MNKPNSVYKLSIYFLVLLAITLSKPLLAQDTLRQLNSHAFVNQYGPATNASAEFENLPSVKARRSLIESTLKRKKPIILWNEFKNDTFSMVQLVATADTAFCKYLVDESTKAPLLNQIFGIYTARPSNLPPHLQANATRYYRVEMYNFALNLTTVALVDFETKQVLSVNYYKQMQADMPQSLIDLGLDIATHAKAVAAELGFMPSQDQANMASTKTALNRTRCERSMHLCVAPTFIKDNRALWAVVDLTDMRLVGVRWTNLGTTKDLMVTERKLQNNTIQDCFCEKVNTLSKNNWSFKYMLSSSDGLLIEGVKYKDRLLFNSAKLVDWHVNYSNTEGMGYSDAVGCPMFSQSAVVATEPPLVAELMEGDSVVGFALEQRYFSELWPTPCNYSYSQRYLFYNDGRFRFTIASLGRGCGNDGTYRPVMRIEPAGKYQEFAEKLDGKWSVWTKENYTLQGERLFGQTDARAYSILNDMGDGFYIEPSVGQFKDGGRGDFAYVYVTKNHPDRDEGSSDLVTIGPCCNTDYRQGPEKFIEQEDIKNSAIVLWYVPQMKNDDTPGKEYCWAKTELVNGIYRIKTYPCVAGPMFVPYKESR